MKKMIHLLLLMVLGFRGWSQEEEEQLEIQEMQLEQQLVREETIPEDDGQWQEAAAYRRRPLQLNRAGEEELQSLQLLQPWQIRSLLLYRKTFGKLLSVYELQAVPGWDHETILRVLPFLSIAADEAADLPFFHRFRGGEKNLLVRSGKLFSTESPSSFIRYRYKMERQLQWVLQQRRMQAKHSFRAYNGMASISIPFISMPEGPALSKCWHWAIFR
ncbi:helix-hairpin-helix domain-containing protein [Pseudobacter ginsenosidimutans]|nr:helix-hairpin-helix domain-containing protein [Pseudobacter ginsenosidimutans]QEC40466.1 helix-hairpin-helix domain-containing protein [Pseudobacter ginsenosidimutans]